MTAREWSLLLALSVLWGGSFFFNEVAVKELPVFTIVVARVVIAAMILHIAMWVTRTPIPRHRRVWLAFFAMGFLNNVIPFCLIVWGQNHIASGLASILNATTPLFTVIVAHVVTSDEKMTPGRVIGVVVGFIGVAVMIGGDMLQSLGVNITAQIACLAAALSYALAGVFGRWFRTNGISPMATATGQVTASSIVLLPAMLIVDQPWALSSPSLAAVGALVGIGALSTALAYLLYFRILATAGATNLLLVTFLIPVSAVMLGVLILNEVLLAKQVFGFALIGFGLVAIDGRPFAMIKRHLRAT
jgi:drug/metabolite transporter (DMT)-like permease